MLERYTEQARRAIFFARYEAHVFKSAWIETEHLLLGLLKEDRILRRHLPVDAPEAIRKQIEQIPNARTSTLVDLPLSVDSQRALAYGAEEAGRLNQERVGSSHITLGLLRIENCTAAILLRGYGIDPDRYRLMIRDSLAELPAGPPEPFQLPTPMDADAIVALENLVGRTRKHLKRYADVYGEQPLLKQPWTRKQALGHLVDWAAAHHMWLAQALTEPRLVASGYPQEDWVSAQRYDNYVWQEIVDLWAALNLLLIHVLARIPAGKRDMECRIGGEKPIPLSRLAELYVERCEGVALSILA